jgi:hypothetical protein
LSVETGVTTRTSIAAVAAISMASLAIPASAETLRPTQSRPHTAVIIRDAYDVAVERLSANVRPDGKRLRVRIDFSAHSRSGKRVVLLRAGRCVRGQLSAPSCPPAYTRRVTLYPNKTVHVTATALLRRPAKRQDAIRILISRPGKQPAKTRPVAELFLRGSAWRGKLAGTFFGYAIHGRAGVDIRAVRVDGAGVSTERLRGTFTWQASSANALSGKTIILPCVGSTCPARETAATFAPGQSATFFDRPTLFRNGGSMYAFQLVATDTNAPLFAVLLPWPG